MKLLHYVINHQHHQFTKAPKSVNVAILPLITSPTLCSLVNFVNGFFLEDF